MSDPLARVKRAAANKRRAEEVYREALVDAAASVLDKRGRPFGRSQAGQT